MALIVQKFGGTSVADTQKILAAARKAIREVKAGNKVVMVVSAMGKNTDHLIALAKEISENPNSRELDMLMSTGEQVTVSLMAMALQSLGHQAVSYTAAQIGIRTDNAFNKARIKSISTERMRKSLDEGKIVIAAGFQGIDDDLNITTLGRGGSDTTAVALAAALGADSCDIYTDVDGVYSADPRIVPEARKMDRISYDEMLEMASLGAGVMHSRSIEFAKKFATQVHVRSSFSDTPGTIIGSEPESDKIPVCGMALEKNESRITVAGVPDVPGVVMKLFSKIAAARIPVDMIVQSAGSQGKTDISFTVSGGDLHNALELVKKVAEEIGAKEVTGDDNLSKVSIVGLGMETRHGVAQTMFRVLAEREINVEMITTSEIKVSVLVNRAQGVEALRAVHAAFQLDREPADRDEVKADVDLSAAQTSLADAGYSSAVLSDVLVSRLSGMEDIVIEQIALDRSQMRVTLSGLPDSPGLAAEVFGRIAEKSVVVDMIVQSSGDKAQGVAEISFTVPRENLAQIEALAEEFKAKHGCEVSWNPTVAKLSVRGTGLRSHTDLALRMFETFYRAKINVSIIGTSERSVNVVIDDADGDEGFKLLKREFGKELA